ncbi:alpha-tocopherol transfer protein-like [Cydia fagiglandana]|uniref:alpha-tocopherol transfer protein-like n=1 Tax=Cydia fagiglandana TaxID=1458189 RepID=UPI002FEE5584
MAHDYPNGLVAILDFRDVNLIDLLAFSTRHFILLQQCLTILKDGYGMRLKGLHVLTKSKATDALVTFAKQLLPEKLAGRLHVHRDMDTLYNFVPKEILPSDLGGDATSLSELQETFVNELFSKEHKEWMEEGNRATINLSKKPKDYFSDDYISISGSFRTLTVD